MSFRLLVNAMVKFTMGVILVGLLIFLPAGTLSYPGGRLLMCLLFIPMFIAGCVLMVRNPSLLERRLNAREKLGEQKLVILLSALMFITGFVVCGLDFRFAWHRLSNGVVMTASAVFLISYALYAEVLRENTYLSRTIEVQDDQKVIDTGLYAAVRHPMYLSTVLLFLSMPLILGSVYGFIIFLSYPFIIAVRIRSEERFLEKELRGYEEYEGIVRYRLIPFIW